MACRDVWNTWPSGLRSPQNPPASPSGFVVTGGPRAMYFTHHGKPWLKPIAHYLIFLNRLWTYVPAYYTVNESSHPLCQIYILNLRSIYTRVSDFTTCCPGNVWCSGWITSLLYGDLILETKFKHDSESVIWRCLDSFWYMHMTSKTMCSPAKLGIRF